MDLEDFIIAVFCDTDDFLKEVFPGPGRRLRQRGPAPTLADSEVLTIEVVGEFLGIDTDAGLYAYFRRHFAALFPALAHVHRTTFGRQAANLWAVKHALWQYLAATASHDAAVLVLDSRCRSASLPARAAVGGARVSRASATMRWRIRPTTACASTCAWPGRA